MLHYVPWPQTVIRGRIILFVLHLHKHANNARPSQNCSHIDCLMSSGRTCNEDCLDSCNSRHLSPTTAVSECNGPSSRVVHSRVCPSRSSSVARPVRYFNHRSLWQRLHHSAGACHFPRVALSFYSMFRTVDRSRRTLTARDMPAINVGIRRTRAVHIHSYSRFPSDSHSLFVRRRASYPVSNLKPPCCPAQSGWWSCLVPRRLRVLHIFRLHAAVETLLHGKSVDLTTTCCRDSHSYIMFW